MSKIINEFIQYGCGYASNPVGWSNFDASPTLYLQRMPLFGGLFKKFVEPRFPDEVIFGDILKGLPIEKESCKGIYCSHVLEHFSLVDFRKVIKNTYDYLAPGGIFRFVMPDLFSLAHKYVISNNPDAAIIFLKESSLGVTIRDRSLIKFLRNYVGNSNHLWLWDFKSAKSELEKVGFKQIRQAYINDSREPKFQEVEDKARWEKCLGIECLK